MPKSKSTPRKGGHKQAGSVVVPAGKPGFDPNLLKRGPKARAQRSGRGKPPRFPGRAGGR